MANGSIRVKSSTLYEIEVNDNGECIYIDTADIGLQAKLIECFDEVEKESKAFDKKEQEILQKISQEDKKENELYTENEKKYIKMQQDYYKKCRNIMDKFLGENACKKIFGDSNYPNMFLDLFKELEPHFEKMKINNQKMQQDLYNKYLKNNTNILK